MTEKRKRHLRELRKRRLIKENWLEWQESIALKLAPIPVPVQQSRFKRVLTRFLGN